MDSGRLLSVEPDFDLEELVNPSILSIPRVFEEYGVARTGDPEPPPRPDDFSIYDGATAYLRVVFAGSPISGWKEPLCVGEVILVPCWGPVWVQRTYVMRPETPDIEHEKIHHRVETGHGLWLTIALVPFTVDTTHMARLMTDYARKAASAVGILAVVTDERFALARLGENALVVQDGQIVRVFDVTRAVRNFTRETALSKDQFVPDFEDAAFSDVRRSARWYLKAAQEGPTPDGIVWLCTAIECLIDPPPGRRRKTFSRAALEQAVRAAGDDPTRFNPDLGRVAGLRSDVVHYGQEQPASLREGYYVLEEVCRLLIRDRIKEETNWPCAVPNAEPGASARTVKRYLHGSEWVTPP